MTPEVYQARCDALLQALLGRRDVVSLWWQSANAHWQMRTPSEVFAEDPETVYHYLLNFYDR
jgi:hypothetical protein